MLIAADYSDVQRLGEELLSLADKVSQMTPELSKAQMVRDFCSDRRKRALSKAVLPFISQGESAASAEHKARALPSYGEELKALGDDLRSAEEVIARHAALKVRWESVRSLLSIQKALTANLQG